MSFFVAFIIIGLLGCEGSKTTPTSHGDPVKDYVSLINHLRAASASVVPTGSVTQPFYSVYGQAIMVNGEQVQVYEFENEADTNADSILLLWHW